MIGDPAARAIDSEIADLQRIIDADEAILEHETSQAKRSVLIAEIDNLQDKIARLRQRRQEFLI